MFNSCVTETLRAYLTGSKESYSGVGPVAESGNKIVFVTYNYRVSSILLKDLIPKLTYS
jgi:hypothetical protein